MKIILILCVAMLFTSKISAQNQTAMTYNIRYDNANNGDNRWDNRKAKLVGLIQFYEPNFLGVQEAHKIEWGHGLGGFCG